MTTKDIIQNRRSAYPPQFTGKDIPRETIIAILDAARYAPTHRLTQPWRFTVYGGDSRETFARAWADAYKTHAGADFNQIKYDKLINKPMQCSHIIVIGMKRNPIVPEFEEIAAVSCAVQNMLLTASDLGAGGYWSTGGHDFFDTFKTHFGLVGEDRLLGFLFLGMPKSISLPPRERLSLEDISQWYD
jgi:nitroreductase